MNEEKRNYGMERPFYRPRIIYAPYPFHMMQEEYSQMTPYGMMPPMSWPLMEYPPEVVDEDSEMDFWRNMYPEKMKRIQSAVDEACDKIDYDGSPMYDEYPDQMTLQRIAMMIYDTLMEEDEFHMNMDNQMQQEQQPMTLESSQMKDKRRPCPPNKPCNPWLRDIVDVLLFEEMRRRRMGRRHNRRYRW